MTRRATPRPAEPKPHRLLDPPRAGLPRYKADLVLDPMCGSGTTCVAAAKLGRRYIGIDASAKAIGVTHERLLTEGSAHEVYSHPDAPADWDDGRNRLVIGDSLAVLRTLPDCFAMLVYCDPPFGSQADQRHFNITWKWGPDSEAALERLRALPEARFAGSGKAATLSFLTHMREFEPNAAAYLAWMAEIIVELRRVMGEPPPLVAAP